MPETIALSSRIRLARNFEEIPFPSHMNAEMAQKVLDKTMDCLKGQEASLGEAHMVRMADLSLNARSELVEQHRISPELAGKDGGALIELMEGSVYVMVNEEDHLRIQAILPGLGLGEALMKANLTDDALEKGGYAFDSRYGYLTACPTNTGTGMRVSVMLHLPALTILQQIGPIIRSVSRIGLTVRGIYGEGSQANGNMYQLSNQITLGRNENEIVHALGEAALQVMQRERDARKVGSAAALLRHTLQCKTHEPEGVHAAHFRCAPCHGPWFCGCAAGCAGPADAGRPARRHSKERGKGAFRRRTDHPARKDCARRIKRCGLNAPRHGMELKTYGRFFR